MRIYFLIITLLLIFSATLSTKAQNTSNVVDLLHPDQSKMQWLTYNAVNKLREEKKLPILVWDDVLYRAAKDHADYLIKEKKISHYQTIKGKRTPAERVKLHGGLIYTTTGENIVEIPLGVQILSKGIKRSTITYESSAKTMAQVWKSSPGHYKNIIYEKYNCTALAVSYDSATQRLIAIQVFGYNNMPGSTSVNLPDYSSHLLNLPIPELPHGLKGYRYKRKNKRAVNGFLELNLDRGYITGKYKAAKKIFRGRRSGISQEFIPLSQFDSASTEFSLVPNRRNGLYELNGKLSDPVYRRKLLRYSRKNTFREYYIYTKLLKIKKPTKEFLYPLDGGGEQTEFNLFLIKNKKLEIFKSYIKIPAKLFDMPFPELDFINSFKPPVIKEKFKLYHTYDTLELKIFYSAGKVIIDSEKQYEIKKTFSRINGKIVTVDASAFASIEGEKSSNSLLAKGRMDYFMALIKPWLDTITIQPKLVTLEQWKLFYSQVEGTRLQFLKQMKLDQIREYVNQNRKDTLLTKLLDEQRYVQIKLIWRRDYKKYLAIKSTVQVYDSLKIALAKFEKPKPNMINALEQAQLTLYYELSQSDSIQDELPPVPDLEKSPGFKYHDLIFQYTVLGSLSEKQFYRGLHSLAKSKYFPVRLKNQALYNNLAMIYDNYINDQLKYLIDYENAGCTRYRQSEFRLKKFKKIKCPKKRGQSFYSPDYFILKDIPTLIAAGKRERINNFPVEELWKYYYLYTIHALYENIPLNPEIYTYLPGFKAHFHPNDAILNDEERLKFSYFYCALKKYSTAKALVEPIANRAEPNKEALKLYLALRYEDFEVEHEFVNYLISEFSRLGKEEWCDLWFSSDYLNFLMFEDLKLKNFYNCNCER